MKLLDQRCKTKDRLHNAPSSISWASLDAVTIIRKDKNVTASALFGVAAIHIFVAGIDWFLHGGQFGRFGSIDWLITFSGPIYLVLGIAARWIRLPAAIIGSVLFAFQAVQSLELLIFDIPVVILLLVAVVSPLKRPAAEP